MGTTAALMVSGLMMTSCTAEPDDSNLYTFTGFTIEQFQLYPDTCRLRSCHEFIRSVYLLCSR